MNTENEKDFETLRLAIEAGVPMPDTCDALAWEKPARYIWEYHSQAGWQLNFVIGKNGISGFYQTLILNQSKYAMTQNNAIHPDEAIYAPTMHEIARELPEALVPFVSHIEWLQIQGNLLSYRGRYAVEIQNHHYAQAYAELFLKLREAGLLKKEVQDEQR